LILFVRRQDCDKRGENAWRAELDRTVPCIKTVYQEGRKQPEEWLPGKPAYLRIYLDILGQHEREKANVPLGKCDSRESARRTADKWIMANGINDKTKLAAALQPAEINISATGGVGGFRKYVPVASSAGSATSAISAFAKQLSTPTQQRSRVSMRKLARCG